MIEEDPATPLNRHYCSVFNKDKEEDKLPKDYAWTFEDLPKDIQWISDIKFSVKDMQRIIRNISGSSAGPSGITLLLPKKTEKIMGPIIWRWCRTVLDTQELPSINIQSFIVPLLKQG